MPRQPRIVPKTRFITGETAPCPTKVISDRAKLINHAGNLAIIGLRVDRSDAKSLIELDDSVESPVLRLHKALATTAFGSVDGQGNFKRIGGDNIPTTTHYITGIYTGPGSKLELF